MFHKFYLVHSSIFCAIYAFHLVVIIITEIKNGNFDPLDVKFNVILFCKDLELMSVEQKQKVVAMLQRQFSRLHSDKTLTLLSSI